MVMVAHLLLKKLDDTYPSSFSEVTLKSLLRDELQFKGVAISDDLAMKAVSDGLKDETFLPRGMQAGMDMFIIAHYKKDRPHLHPLKLAENLANALKARTLTEERCVESYNRVQKIIDLAKNEMDALSGDEFEEHESLIK